MALEQAIKLLFFKGILQLIKGVCTLSLLTPAESQISILAISPTLIGPMADGIQGVIVQCRA
jgi:hypothetical protein